MRPILIIGYGNPLRSDDGIGWQSAKDLFDEWPTTTVRVIASHQLTPEMAEEAANARLVIFIDACWDAVPGRIRSCSVHPEDLTSRPESHHFTPAGLLATAKALYGSCPEAILFSIGGASFEHGEHFSESVRTIYPALLFKVKKLVCQRLGQAAVKEKDLSCMSLE